MKKIIKKHSKRSDAKSKQQGAAIVEFAIILPIFILLLFGIIEFSILLFNKQVVTNASREGARAGIVARPERMSNLAISTISKSYCEQYLVTFGSKNVDVSVKPADRCLTYGCPLQVQVDFDYEFLFLKTIGIAPTKISSIATMRME